MAVEGQTGRKTREEVVAERDAMVPLAERWDPLGMLLTQRYF